MPSRSLTKRKRVESIARSIGKVTPTSAIDWRDSEQPISPIRLLPPLALALRRLTENRRKTELEHVCRSVEAIIESYFTTDDPRWGLADFLPPDRCYESLVEHINFHADCIGRHLRNLVLWLSSENDHQRAMLPDLKGMHEKEGVATDRMP